MKNLFSTLFLTLFIATPVFAGAGHSHGPDGSHHYPAKEVALEQIKAKAEKKVMTLANAGKIDASWNGVKPANSEKKKFGNNLEWVIRFDNPSIQDKGKQKLYLFYSLSGLYIAANYSGK